MIINKEQKTNIIAQALRYGITGLLVSLFGFSLILTLHDAFGLTITYSNIVGYSVGLALSYLINRNWTFAVNGQPAKIHPIIFIINFAISFGLNLIVVYSTMAVGASFTTAQACGMLAYSVFFFLGLKYT